MTVRRLWVPAVVAAMVAALVGPSMLAGAEPRTVMTGTVMVGAAAAIANDGEADYHNYGNYAAMVTGEGSFLIPVSFPVPVVTIKRVTLYALDNAAGSRVTVSVYRHSPPGGITAAHMGDLVTVDSADNPQVATTTEISPRLVNTANQDLFLWVYLPSPDLKFYGVKILYSYEV